MPTKAKSSIPLIWLPDAGTRSPPGQTPLRFPVRFSCSNTCGVHVESGKFFLHTCELIDSTFALAYRWPVKIKFRQEPGKENNQGVQLYLEADSEADTWSLFHSIAFDFSVWEMWGAWMYGGRVAIVPYWVSRTPEEFLEFLKKEKVTVLNQMPSAFRQLSEAEGQKGRVDLGLRWVIFWGKALEEDLKSAGLKTARGGSSPPLGTNQSAAQRIVL